MNERDTENKSKYYVVKANELIQKSRFSLSLPEQKTIAFICSMIKPIKETDETAFLLEYDFDVQEYCKICNIDFNSGKNYADVKEILKKLRDKSMWLTLENGSETLVGWLSKTVVNKKSGIVHIKLDEDMIPYLFDLKKRFTKYQLYNVLSMKSAFSVRIYELMKSYANLKTITFDIDELKKMLMVEDVKSYNRFPDFRRKVLEKAIQEINALTDIRIGYEPITKGRKVVKLKFNIFQLQKEESKLKTESKVAECQEQRQNQRTLYAKTKESNSKMLNHRFNQFPQREYTKEQFAELERRVFRKGIGKS